MARGRNSQRFATRSIWVSLHSCLERRRPCCIHQGRDERATLFRASSSPQPPVLFLYLRPVASCPQFATFDLTVFVDRKLGRGAGFASLRSVPFRKGIFAQFTGPIPRNQQELRVALGPSTRLPMPCVCLPAFSLPWLPAARQPFRENRCHEARSCSCRSVLARAPQNSACFGPATRDSHSSRTASKLLKTQGGPHSYPRRPGACIFSLTFRPGTRRYTFRRALQASARAFFDN